MDGPISHTALARRFTKAGDFVLTAETELDLPHDYVATVVTTQLANGRWVRETWQHYGPRQSQRWLVWVEQIDSPVDMPAAPAYHSH